MFTGLVQAVGVVDANAEYVLAIDVSGPIVEPPVDLGESVAVNGCCLTVVEAVLRDSGTVTLKFDMSGETLARTNLGGLTSGSRVNVERAMRPMDRLGGHIVQGHVDAVGEVVGLREDGEFTVFRFQAPNEYGRYLIDKGSVAVDGISLTVVKPVGGEFDVWVIPHTLRHTNLESRKAGDAVNFEFDVLAKYVEQLLAAGSQVSP